MDDSPPRPAAPPAPDTDPTPDTPDFDPSQDDWLDHYQATALRYRHDGFTPQRQYDFLCALAESGCVAEACARVGVSDTAAYDLRRRPGSTQFRAAWEAALRYAVDRLGDAAFSRALHGTVRPVFYKGEQVGERRYFDERLTMFILRTRAVHHYGKWIDNMVSNQPLDGPAFLAEHFARNAFEDAMAQDLDLPPRRRPEPQVQRFDDGDGDGADYYTYARE